MFIKNKLIKNLPIIFIISTIKYVKIYYSICNFSVKTNLILFLFLYLSVFDQKSELNYIETKTNYLLRHNSVHIFFT